MSPLLVQIVNHELRFPNTSSTWDTSIMQTRSTNQEQNIKENLLMGIQTPAPRSTPKAQCLLDLQSCM